MTTAAEAMPYGRVKRLTADGRRAVETSDDDSVGVLGEILGDKPEKARLIGQVPTGGGRGRRTSVRQRGMLERFCLHHKSRWQLWVILRNQGARRLLVDHALTEDCVRSLKQSEVGRFPIANRHFNKPRRVR